MQPPEGQPAALRQPAADLAALVASLQARVRLWASGWSVLQGTAGPELWPVQVDELERQLAKQPSQPATSSRRGSLEALASRADLPRGPPRPLHRAPPRCVWACQLL